MTFTKWERKNRHLAYDSRFVKIYEDTVLLPNGTLISDYTVVERPNVVIVVATDKKGNVVVIREYKYAANDVFWVLPAGHMEPDEDPIEAAKRELKEETGYGGGEFQIVQMLLEHPTKDIYTIAVVRATDVELKHKLDHEETEQIELELKSPDEIKKMIAYGDWKVTSTISALTVSGVLF